MLKLKILALLCSIFLSMSLMADDDDYHKKFKEYKENYYKSSSSHFYRNLDYLNLSNEQSSKLKEILIKYKVDYKKFYKFKKIKEFELSKFFKDDKFSKENYISIYQEIRNRALEIEVSIFSEIHNILDKEQREKFSHFLEEWRVE